MKSVRITYDAEGDILYLSFGAPREATGCQISDQILLRLVPDRNEAAGLTIFNFLHHIHSGTGINLNEGEISGDTLEMLVSLPIARFLNIERSDRGTIAHLLQPSLQESVSALSGPAPTG